MGIIFSTLHNTPFLCGKIQFEVLHLLRARQYCNVRYPSCMHGLGIGVIKSFTGTACMGSSRDSIERDWKLIIQHQSTRTILGIHTMASRGSQLKE